MLKTAMAGLLVGLLVFRTYTCQAQADTVRIMSYNTLNYDELSVGCTDNLNYKKNKYLRDIIRYVNPDIVGLVKMNLVPDFVNDSIPALVLDSVCQGCWGHSTLTYKSLYGKCNMLYFKTSKFGFLRTQTIYSADPSISDINLHQLYYKDTALARTHDTVFLNIVLVHDLSGSSSSAQRTKEIQGAMTWLDAHVHTLGNYIFMGDFNVKSSNEGCFQAMINPSNTGIRFNEPTGKLGNWGAYPGQYPMYITQSTRTAKLPDCGSAGGMNDWLDHIMCSDYLMNGADAFTYVPGSFTVVGQDGKHVQKALIDAPKDTIVPAYLVNDIYHMSNHMPVTLKLAVNPQHRYVGIVQDKTADAPWATWFYAGNALHIKTGNMPGNSDCRLVIYNSLGRLALQKEAPAGELNTPIDISFLPGGFYVVSLLAGGRLVARGKMIKL